jgi:hypothetical protein
MIASNERFYEALSNPSTPLSKAATQYYENLATFFHESHAEGKIHDAQPLIEMLGRIDPRELFDINGKTLAKEGSSIEVLTPLFNAYNLQTATVATGASLAEKAASSSGAAAFAAKAKSSWVEKMAVRAERNMLEGSLASRIVRGAGVGLGAAYTIGGVTKLFTPTRQAVTPEGETAQTPSPSKMGALLQIAAGAGVVAASLFLKGKGAGASL